MPENIMGGGLSQKYLPPFLLMDASTTKIFLQSFFNGKIQGGGGGKKII